jgi:hypothetical protein
VNVIEEDGCAPWSILRWPGCSRVRAFTQPERHTHADLTKIVLNNVRDYGWHCVNVIEEDGCPPWSYSIGFYETFGFPELIVIGRSRATAQYILKIIADRLERNESPDLTLPNISIVPGVMCLFREVLPRYYADYVGFALWFYRKRKFPMYQVVWSNSQGLYPWNAEAPDLPRVATGVERP